MARGSKTHEKLNSSPKSEIAEKETGKVRKDNRNNIMFHRYYYYSRLHKMKYEDILECLESEFHLSPDSISKIIGSNLIEVKNLFAKNLTVRQLDEKFPSFKWPEYEKPERPIRLPSKQESFILKDNV